MPQYPLVIENDKYYYIFNSRWTLFPVCLSKEFYKLEIFPLKRSEEWSKKIKELLLEEFKETKYA